MISHSAVAGGMNDVVSSLLERRPPGVEASWLFLEPGPVAATSPVPHAVVPSGRARQVWKAPGVIRAVRGAIRAAQADVVFAHVTKAHLYAAVAARLEGVPELWWQQERIGQKPLMHGVAGRMRARAVICSADHTAAQQREHFRGTPVVRIHLGARHEHIGTPRVHTERDRVVLGVVGRLQRWKRVELAIRALPAIRARVPGVRLRVIGDACPGLDEDYPDQLRAEARALGVADCVDFTGHVDDGPAAIADLDVLVHCAEVEPFGLVVVEAMLRGVPVVAPAEGGPLETLRDGTDGILVDAKDTDALAAAVVRLAGDPELRNVMGAAGRERALREFTAEAMARRAWAVVQSVAAGDRPTGVAAAAQL